MDEARKLMRLVNVESLKKKLEIGGEEVIGYNELLKVCQDMGVVKDIHEAKNFAKVLDDAGVVVLFRDKVYLHPDKVKKKVTIINFFFNSMFEYHEFRVVLTKKKSKLVSPDC